MALEGVNRFGAKAAIGGRSSSVVIWEKYRATFGDWPLMQPIARVQSISVFKNLGRHASIRTERGMQGRPYSLSSLECEN